MATKGILDRLRGLARRVFRRERAGPREAPDAREAWSVASRQLNRLRREIGEAVDNMLDPVESKTHKPMWFLDFMTGKIRNYYMTVLAAGAGGAGNVTRQELRMADDMLRGQRSYLIKWVAQLERTPKEKWSKGQMVTRAMMYFDSAKQLLSWQATVVNVGMPELPFQPADRTICHNNCKCSWRVIVKDAEAGDYDAYWILSPVEHCETCIKRSIACNPLQIRNGQYTLNLTGLVT